jgi:DNA-binding CsgD family transcriptional regulator/PAS domain-containing protein
MTASPAILAPPRQYCHAVSNDLEAMTEAVSSRALSELIGSIYDCALDPDLWEPTLGCIRDALGCQNAQLHLSDLRSNRLLISKVVGFEWTDLGTKHLPEAHARLVEFFAAHPSLDEPFVALRDLSPAYRDASPYFRECIRPQGLADMMQYCLMQTPDRFAGLGFARNLIQGPFTERELELGGLLLPHIKRAVTISNVLDARTIEKARMTETLDALQCGVVLTDANGTILHANQAAEEMLRSGTPIRGNGRILGASAASATEELFAAIKLAAQDEAKIGKTGLAVRLTGRDRLPCVAHVLPMNGSELRTRLRPAAVAAVFIAQPGKDADGIALAAAFGLTPAETQVLSSLLAGRTRAETSAHLGITLATTKTHLINIFAKAGVTRQAELMRLVSQVLPPVKRQP